MLLADIPTFSANASWVMCRSFRTHRNISRWFFFNFIPSFIPPFIPSFIPAAEDHRGGDSISIIKWVCSSLISNALLFSMQSFSILLIPVPTFSIKMVFESRSASSRFRGQLNFPNSLIGNDAIKPPGLLIRIPFDSFSTATSPFSK